MTEILAAVQCLRAAKDVLKATLSLRVTAEVQAKLTEIGTLLIDAQSATLDVQAQLEELREDNNQLVEQIKRYESWDQEKARYELVKAREGRPTYVYRLKSKYESDEPTHNICPNCYEDRVKSILQLEYYGSRGSRGIDRKTGSRLECTRCSFGAQVA